MRFPHHLMARILPGSDDQPRLKCLSGDHEVIRCRARAATDKVHDFQFVSLHQDNRLPRCLWNDCAIALHGNAFLRQIEKVEQLDNAQGVGKRLDFPIEANLNGHDADGSTAKRLRI